MALYRFIVCVRDWPCAPGWPLVGRPVMSLSVFPGSNEWEVLAGDGYFVTPVSNSGVMNRATLLEMAGVLVRRTSGCGSSVATFSLRDPHGVIIFLKINRKEEPNDMWMSLLEVTTLYFCFVSEKWWYKTHHPQKVIGIIYMFYLKWLFLRQWSQKDNIFCMATENKDWIPLLRFNCILLKYFPISYVSLFFTDVHFRIETLHSSTSHFAEGIISINGILESKGKKKLQHQHEKKFLLPTFGEDKHGNNDKLFWVP